MTDKSKAESPSLGKSKVGDGNGQSNILDNPVAPIKPIIPPDSEVKFEHQQRNVLSLSKVSAKGEPCYFNPDRSLEITQGQAWIQVVGATDIYKSEFQPVENGKTTKYLIPKSAFGAAGDKVFYHIQDAHNASGVLNIVE